MVELTDSMLIERCKGRDADGVVGVRFMTASMMQSAANSSPTEPP